jgi:hypothetical protein
MRTTFQLLFSPEGDGGAAGGGSAGGGGTLLAGAGEQGGSQTQTAGQTSPNGQQSASNGAVVTKSFREGWIGPDGKIDKSVYDRLPDHLKPHADLFKRYDKDEDILGALAHQASLVGKKGLMPLPPGASDKDKAEFNARIREIMRVPEKPEGYGLKRPENVPAELWNDDYAKGVSEIAHKHNVSPDALSELAKFDSEFAVKSHGASQAQIQKQLDEGKAALQSEWAGDFGKNVSLAARAARTAGLDPETHPAFRNADVVKAFAKFGAMVSSDSLVSGEGAGNTGGDDTQKALDIINNKANPLNAAYWNDQDPQHTHAKSQVEAFNRRALALKKR